MIGAHEARAIALAIHQDRAAVAADIRQDTELQVIAPERHDGLVAELEGHEVAGFGHLVAAPDANPFLAIEMLALQRQNGRICVI